MVRVVVAGAAGRVGQAMMAQLGAQDGIELLRGFGRGDDLSAALADADVVVDFTKPDTAPDLLRAAVAAGVRPVSGTSGLPPSFLDELDAAAREKGIGAVWAANFAVGAALMMHLAQIAARYMDSAEVIEMHHDGKLDAPSGTAVTTAKLLREARGSDLPDPPVHKLTLPEARGAVQGGVRIHSLRLPGAVAHQQVVFGSLGQILTIRHDALGRDTYVPGVTLATRYVMSHPGLTNGLERVMGLA